MIEPMLTSLTVERYRPFAERTRIELRPLTLLFGYNNAGKSALLRTLPLLSESIAEPGRNPLKQGAASRGGGFHDLVSKIVPSATSLSLGLGWDRSNSFLAEIRDLPDRRRQIVIKLEMLIAGRKIVASWNPSVDGAGQPGSHYAIDGVEGERELQIEMHGLIPFLPNEPSTTQAGELFGQVREGLSSNTAGIQWLSSLRHQPDRSFLPDAAPATRLGSDGGGAEQILFFDRVDRGHLLPEVSEWFERHFDQTLDIHEVGETAYLALSPRSAPTLRVPLADTGEGIAQVLPVLVALALSRSAEKKTPQLLALEQPELHLHPAAELALARQFVHVAAQRNPPVLLIETHSENLLLSVQLQVAEGLIPPDRVAVYWIERLQGGGATIRTIDLDEQGQAQNWPRGVFSEDLQLARRLYNARQRARSE
jgi:hypothetical protein